MSEKIMEILRNKFTGSEHLGEVYFLEATEEIMAPYKKAEEEVLQDIHDNLGYALDDTAPLRQSIRDLQEHYFKKLTRLSPGR